MPCETCDLNGSVREWRLESFCRTCQSGSRRLWCLTMRSGGRWVPPVMLFDNEEDARRGEGRLLERKVPCALLKWTDGTGGYNAISGG